MGECTKDTAFELLDTFYDLGGNFIDTANAYQGGQSEEWIGEWLEKSGRRTEMVIATKYTMSPMIGLPVQGGNFGGTGTKSMHTSIHDSLKRLKTDYVDLVRAILPIMLDEANEHVKYFVHFWDFATGIPELMQSLNVLVNQGKVLYLGISDAPAWVVVKCNAYAREHGLRPFSVYQGRYSAQTRDLEREIIPMCRDEGMAVQAFSVLGGGYFKPPGSAPQEGGRNTAHMKVGREEKVSAVLDAVAKRHNVPLTSVAIAYALQKVSVTCTVPGHWPHIMHISDIMQTPYLFPILGGRKVAHLKSNIEALALELTAEDNAEIDKAYDFDLGFPHSFLSATGHTPQVPQHINVLGSLGHFDYVEPTKAIKPHKGQQTETKKD